MYKVHLPPGSSIKNFEYIRYALSQKLSKKLKGDIILAGLNSRLIFFSMYETYA